ncbi:MAG: biotin/lipoate--protein ligase family protein [Alphaproteobacteria bacterium]
MQIVLEPPSLPPAFSFYPVDGDADPLLAAREIARGDIDATGAVVQAMRTDRLDCAIILNPEVALGDALNVVPTAFVALNDALGSIIPPQIAITYGWPDRIMINHALAGGFSLAAPEGADADTVVDWLALRIVLDVLGRPDQDRQTPGERTSLVHEGCVDVSPKDIVESFTRHMLSWINRWQDSGFEAIRENASARLEGLEERIDFHLPGGRIKGRLMDLNPQAGIVVSRDGKRRIAPIKWMLKGQGWALDPVT